MRSYFGAVVELGKLRLSALAVVAVVAGMGMAGSGTMSPAAVAGVGAGALLVAAAGGAFNMWLERERDARMPRTAQRPLPAGRLSPRAALVYATLSAAVGHLLVWLSSNLLATGLCAAILCGYVLVYTPLKPVTTLSMVIGAVPGALPPVVGFAAATACVDVPALALFTILFLWQIPHFLAIGWRYREDYRKGGLRVLAVVDHDGRRTAFWMVVSGICLLLASLWPWRLAMTGPRYAYAAAGLGASFLLVICLGAARRTEPAMRAVFVASLIYLPALYSALYLDRA